MTVRTILTSSDPPFTWVDVVGPSREELGEIARRYGLHPMSVEDSLEPEHLPKYERIGSTTFIIVRAIDTAAVDDCSTLHEMTRKVAIFYGADFLITIHRTEQPFLTELIEGYRNPQPPEGTAERRKGYMPRLLVELINGAVATYQKPLEEAEAAVDKLEATVFGEHEFTGLLRRIYLVKRRVTLMRRMLSHTLDAVKKLVPGSEPTAPSTRTCGRTSRARTSGPTSCWRTSTTCSASSWRSRRIAPTRWCGCSPSSRCSSCPSPSSSACTV